MLDIPSVICRTTLYEHILVKCNLLNPDPNSPSTMAASLTSKWIYNYTTSVKEEAALNVGHPQHYL